MLVPWLLAALSVAPAAPGAPVAASGELQVATIAEEPASLAGAWRFHIGDDAAFAAADFDDATWALVNVPQGLGEQGYAELSGLFWLRLHVHVPAPVTRELSIRLGPVDTASEVFIDGVNVGGTGRLLPVDEAHDVTAIYPVPLDATRDGELVIAIRGVRSELRKDASPTRGGLISGPLWIGTTGDVVRAQLVRDLDKLIAGPAVLVVALYHLLLFRSRRKERHYLWFGLFSLCMFVYLLASSDVSLMLMGTIPHGRVFWPALILSLPTFAQFLFPFLDRPIRPWLRFNQAAMTAYAVVAAAWPTQWFVIKFIKWFELFLMAPLMLVTTFVVMQSAWRGNREARTLLLGTLGLVAAAADNILLERTTLPLPQIMPYANVLFIFSIAISLANRFSRVFSELDQKNVELMRMERLNEEVRLLNAQVQSRVKERSAALTKALTDLQRRDDDGAANARASRVESGSLAPGAVLDGRYAIDRVLGVGGMGAVYAGRDLAGGVRVAVKVIRTSSLPQIDALHRFLREARAAVAVDHPAIVRMLHVDISDDGLFYQVQELVDGGSLEERLRQGVLEPPLAVLVCAILADALAAAHGSGVIHRDVKPGNIMLANTPPGVKLLDFGVAKITDASSSSSDAVSDETGTGRHIGTPAYMAPEQRFIASDAAVTAKVDVFALGVVLFRAVAGGLPGRVLDAAIPAAVRDVIDDCLRDDPAARPSAAALAKRLHDLAAGLGAPAALPWISASSTPAPPSSPPSIAAEVPTESAAPPSPSSSSLPVITADGSVPAAGGGDGFTDILREIVRTPP